MSGYHEDPDAGGDMLFALVVTILSLAAFFSLTTLPPAQ